MKLDRVALLIVVVSAAGICRGELLMFEPFDSTADKGAAPAEGRYVEAGPLMVGTNPEVAGGRMVGFSAGEPWKGQTQLPRVMPAPSGRPNEGHLVFRGNTDQDDRAVWRSFAAAESAEVEFFGVTLTPTWIDPDGTILVAFAQRGSDSAAVAKAFLDGTDDEQGFALGFRGNERGGMDLVMRSRDIDVQPSDAILVEDVQEGTAYEVVLRVAWDTIPRGTSPRDEVTIWVNPGEEGERAESTQLVVTAGAPGLIDTLYLLLLAAGDDANDVATADTIWIGTEFADRPVGDSAAQ